MVKAICEEAKAKLSEGINSFLGEKRPATAEYRAVQYCTLCNQWHFQNEVNNYYRLKHSAHSPSHTFRCNGTKMYKLIIIDVVDTNNPEKTELTGGLHERTVGYFQNEAMISRWAEHNEGHIDSR